MRRIGQQWFVFHGSRVDPDIQDAFRWAIKRKAVTTTQKIARFIEDFLNFHFMEGEPDDAFIQERWEASRERIEYYLEALGYEVADGDREDDAKLVHIGTAGGLSGLPSCLKALTRIYARMSSRRLRPRANPCKVDNWHILPPEVRRDLEETIYDKRLKYRNYRGSQYLASPAEDYAIRMEDPIGLGARVLDAGRRFGWPAAIYDQVTIMDEEGLRWVDTYDLNAADWAEASGFGTKLWGPNKASKGIRVKTILISLDTIAQLRASFDADPARPDFAELQRLYDARDMEALRAIPLFPSILGRPFSYHTFNNSYFRPAMERYGVNIVSETSIARATAHRLRAGRLQEEVEHIYRPGRTHEQIQQDTADLKRDVSLQSDAALNRYIGPVKAKHAERSRAERKQARAKRRVEASGKPLADPVFDRPPTALQIRMRSFK